MLVALTLSITQSVWASVCSPDPQPVAEDCDHEAPASEPARDDSHESTECPFTPFSAGGSCVSAATPAAKLALEGAAPPHDEAVHGSAADAHDLLLVHSLFHPPRA